MQTCETLSFMKWACGTVMHDNDWLTRSLAHQWQSESMTNDQWQLPESTFNVDPQGRINQYAVSWVSWSLQASVQWTNFKNTAEQKWKRLEVKMEKASFEKLPWEKKEPVHSLCTVRKIKDIFNFTNCYFWLILCIVMTLLNINKYFNFWFLLIFIHRTKIENAEELGSM